MRAYTEGMRILTLLLLCWPLLGAAEMYRWVDAQGRVHYSQVKPSGQAAEKLAPAAPAAAPTARMGLSEYASRIDKENAAADKARGEAEKKRELRESACSRARGELKFRTDYEGRTFTVNEKGEHIYGNAAQDAQIRQQLQAVISENCTP